MNASESVRLVIATRNRHKVEEIQAILADRFHCLSLNQFPAAPPVEEDGATFAANATKKAVTLAHWLAEQPGRDSAELSGETYVLADDSGLEVDALNGAPGVYSARFAAPDGRQNSPDAENNAKLLRLLESVPEAQRTARFRCVLALTPVIRCGPAVASPVCLQSEAELRTEIFEGVCEGRIAPRPSGAGGFGYDPLFIPRGHPLSFAELGEAIKNRISHRAQALQALQRHWPKKPGSSPS